MLVNRYIDLKYAYGFYEHFNEHCSCDLREGGQGLCNYGRYIDELISPEEFLQEYEDDFYDLKYGTFVRTDQDDIARIIGVEAESSKIFFILDREVERYSHEEIIKTNKIRDYNIDEHSNQLKDLVKEGDIVNGRKIIKIDNGKLWYGYYGDDYLKGPVREVLTKKKYLKESVVG